MIHYQVAVFLQLGLELAVDREDAVPDPEELAHAQNVIYGSFDRNDAVGIEAIQPTKRRKRERERGGGGGESQARPQAARRAIFSE